MLVILMNGYPATGKTTTAQRLFRRLSNDCKVLLVSTLDVRKRHSLFNLGSEFERDKIYDMLAEELQDVIDSQSADILIVDGNFNTRKRREKIYALVKSHELCVIRCVIKDISVIRMRLDYRLNNQHIEENKAASMDLYNLIKDGSDAVEGDVVEAASVTLMEYESVKGRITVLKKVGQHNRKYTIRIIQELMDHATDV